MQGDVYMKKALLITWCILLLPAVSFAGEKTLVDIAEDMLTLAEATISCTTSGGTCTEADALALKADAVNGLQDIVGIVKAGNLSGAKLPLDHIQSLYARVSSLKLQLAESGLFQTTCNFGFYLLQLAGGLMFYGLFLIVANLQFPGSIIRWGICVLSLASALGLVPIACLVLLTCYFWWL
jgi:hypothetical protein